MNTKSNELDLERSKVNFSIEEFTNFYYGGAQNVAKKRFLENYFLSDKRLNLQFDTSYLSYKDKYEEAMRRSVLILEKLRKLHENLGGGEDDFMEILDNIRLAMQCVNKDGNPITLHYGMFAFALQTLTSDEQKAKWLPKLLNFQIFGTYSQTELGHGTFVRGLETTATYDPQTIEFILNSPTLTSFKWWPGHLGKTSNFTVLMAKLISNGQNCGVQPFIVQIRDLKSHKSLQGISIGDIGNKIGFDTVNNGFLGFDNVRVPLENMLMKNAKLHEDGTFEKLNDPLLNYGVMLYTRVSIILDAALVLSKAAAISVRYSLVRRQSPIEPAEDEPKIIEHITQQQKIFPALINGVVFKVMARHLLTLRLKVSEELKEGNLSRLPELHALSCGLKSVCTNDAVKLIEICRLSCGGHGYLESSGLHTLYKFAVTYQTYEGDNTILLLQTARFLMKSYERAKSGKLLVRGVNFIDEYLSLNGRRLKFSDDIQGILKSIQTTVAGKIEKTWESLETEKKISSPEMAANLKGIELTKIAELHIYAYMLQTLIEELSYEALSSSTELQDILKNILEFFAISLILNLLAHVLLFVDITNEDIEKLQKRLENCLKFFRTAAIGIVDGFDYSDELLNSTLGAYDGNVYERLYEAAKKSPLNQEDVNKSFHLYLKPFMKSNL